MQTGKKLEKWFGRADELIVTNFDTLEEKDIELGQIEGLSLRF